MGEHYVLLTIILPLMIVCVWVGVFLIVQDTVRKQSKRMRCVDKLNQLVVFYSVKSLYSYETKTNSKAKFDSFQFEQFLQNIVYEERDLFEKMIINIKSNREWYGKYMNAISVFPEEIILKDARKCGIPIKVFRSIEDKLVKDLIQTPVTNTTVRCVVHYSSPQGRNYYSRVKDFSFEELEEIYKTACTLDTRKAQMSRERSLVTPKLRYTVMRRDHFRCQLCGRRQSDGVVLHVDHIIPVSKGGKTELGNLRTLCDYCNIGKGNSYDPAGYN